jgi:uncharacterized protein YjbJ (UPF0337 family)
MYTAGQSWKPYSSTCLDGGIVASPSPPSCKTPKHEEEGGRVYPLLPYLRLTIRVGKPIFLSEGADGVPGKSSREDKNEGAMDRAKGRVKEAGGALSGDKGKKREGRSDQRKGRAKEKKGDLKDLLK